MTQTKRFRLDRLSSRHNLDERRFTGALCLYYILTVNIHFKAKLSVCVEKPWFFFFFFYRAVHRMQTIRQRRSNYVLYYVRVFLSVPRATLQLISAYLFVLDYCVAYGGGPRIRRIVFISTVFSSTPRNPKPNPIVRCGPNPKHVLPISATSRPHATDE